VGEAAPLVIRCEARGFAFDIHGDTAVRRSLTDLFAALERHAGSAEAVFSVGRPGGDGTPWHVEMDGELMMGCEHAGEALHGLMVHINQRVVAARRDLLSVHAAAVATPEGAVLLPGASGSGKTTLCARLLQQGAAYLSDDSIALDRQGCVLGYPKPLGFKIGTWEQFADAGLDDLQLGDGHQLVWQIPPDRLGSPPLAAAEAAAVVVPRFKAGAALRIEPIGRHEAAAALLEQVQNLASFGTAEALAVIGQVAAGSSGHAAVYGDAREAAAAVLGLVQPGQRHAPAPYEVFWPEAPAANATQPFAAPDVSALCFADGGLVVRGSGEFARLDAVGSVIWPFLDGQRSAAAIAAELASLFGAGSPEVEQDIARWVDELVERGFVVRPSE